ncbi:putative cytochrome 71A1-like [Capsicum annuum]|nr:putative cytochrome 71A1-like [Capsicum annuum]KAF3661703.1 putative cytochrome 71A1-like [Capsicum annuum]
MKPCVAYFDSLALVVHLVVIVVVCFLCCELGLISLLALAFLSKNFNHSKNKLPPGPRPWLIIGNLNLIGSLPHESLPHLSQKYGNLRLLKFGSKPVLVASSPEMAKEILQTHDAIFASCPTLTAGKYIIYNNSDVSWAPYSAHWQQGRKIYQTELFNPKRLDSFKYIRVEERRNLISHLYFLSGKPVFLKDHLPKFTLCTISRMVMSDKYYSDDESTSMLSIEQLELMLDEFFILGGVITFGDWIPWLNWLDLQGYIKRMKALEIFFTEYLTNVLEDHKANAKEDSIPKDMVDGLLQLANDPNLVVKLTTNNLMGFILDLFAGGMETSARTVEWAFQELASKPKIIEKAKQELDRKGKETFRLHPLTTLLPPHCSLEDCNVAGINSKNWDRPDKFIPERFLENDIVIISGNNFTLFPFGSGRSQCPGYSLEIKLFRTTMANLLHGFNWKFAGGMKSEDISMEEIYGLTTHTKKPISIIMEPRLPLHLY